MNPISGTNLSPFLNTAGMGTTVQTPAAPSAATTPGAGQAGAGANFMQSLTDAIGSLNGLQTNADQAVAGLALNQGVDIDQAMIAMEQASLGMHYAVQVRDKAVEAYQTLMNMQM